MNYPHIEAAQSSEDLEHDCTEHLELRSRQKTTGIAYAYQCQFCGEFRGGEVSKKSVSIIPPPSDNDLFNCYEEKRLGFLNASLSKIKRFYADETVYRAEKNQEQKLSEIKQIIENYCLENNTDIKNLLSLFLMRQRDAYIEEGYVSKWNNESELHEWFESNFSEWFEIYHEVTGEGFVNRQRENVQIDFVIKARQPLIQHGFTDQFIGVEVKYLNPKYGHGFHGKSSRGVFQALSYWYSGARWNINGRNIELATVLVFSNLSFHDEAEQVFGSIDRHYKSYWRAYLSIANHANVGELLVKTKGNQVTSWAMEYSGTKYYAMYKSKGFVKGNPNVINKKRIGSTKR